MFPLRSAKAVFRQFLDGLSSDRTGLMCGTLRLMARRILVRGEVQGVGFRAWTERTARALGLSGWVRNRADGGVDIHAEGEPGAEADLEAACRHGPPSARVDEVLSRDVPVEGDCRFIIRYDDQS